MLRKMRLRCCLLSFCRRCALIAMHSVFMARMQSSGDCGMRSFNPARRMHSVALPRCARPTGSLRLAVSLRSAHQRARSNTQSVGKWIGALITNGRLEESVIELGFTQDAVDAQDQIALLAVIQRAINRRKCWTQGRLKGNDDGHSWLGCCLIPRS